jgi:hypothetical protein
VSLWIAISPKVSTNKCSSIYYASCWLIFGENGSEYLELLSFLFAI